MACWVNKQFRELGEIIYLGEVKELQRIEDRDGGLWIGAGASLEDAWQALAQRWPALTRPAQAARPAPTPPTPLALTRAVPTLPAPTSPRRCP